MISTQRRGGGGRRRVYFWPGRRPRNNPITRPSFRIRSESCSTSRNRRVGRVKDGWRKISCAPPRPGESDTPALSRGSVSKDDTQLMLRGCTLCVLLRMRPSGPHADSTSYRGQATRYDRIISVGAGPVGFPALMRHRNTFEVETDRRRSESIMFSSRCRARDQSSRHAGAARRIGFTAKLEPRGIIAPIVHYWDAAAEN